MCNKSILECICSGKNSTFLKIQNISAHKPHYISEKRRLLPHKNLRYLNTFFAMIKELTPYQ